MSNILSLNCLSICQVQWIQHLDQMKTSFYAEMSSCQPNLRRKSCQTIKIISILSGFNGFGCEKIIDRYIFPVFQDRNIPCTIIVFIRMLYKYSAVCRITKQNLFFIVCSWLKLTWSETKFTVNFRNRVLWLGPQIITAGSSAVRFDYVMLLGIDSFFISL